MGLIGGVNPELECNILDQLFRTYAGHMHLYAPIDKVVKKVQGSDPVSDDGLGGLYGLAYAHNPPSEGVRRYAKTCGIRPGRSIGERKWRLAVNGVTWGKDRWCKPRILFISAVLQT